MPFYISIGVSKAEILDSNPKGLKPYIKANKLRKMQKDEEQFYLMHYMSSAVIYAVEHCLAGKKAKTELIKEPVLAHLLEEEQLNEMTEEERYELEVKKAIANEEAWITASRMKGLPDTIV